MTDTEDPKATKEEVTLECRGGWAFLLFGLGVFGLVPACLLLSIYASATTYGAAEIGTYTFFAFTAACLLIGIVMTAHYCRVTDCCLKNVAAADVENGNADKKKGKDKGKDKDNKKDDKKGSTSTKV